MKKVYLIAAAIGLAVAITACSGKSSDRVPEESSVSSEAEETKETGEGKDKAKEEEKETEKVKEGTDNETVAVKEAEKKIVTGQVEEVKNTIVTISGEDGTEYQIDLKDAETRSELEIGEGDEIQVVFLEEGEEVKKAQSYDIISSAVLEGNLDPVIEGTIQNASQESVTIETAGKKTYQFSTAIAQIVTGDKGLAAGEMAEITCLGRPEEGVALRVVTESGSGNVEATYSALLGTLISASDSQVTLQAENGSQFTFAVGENIDATDYEAGEAVEITYEGSLTKNTAVVEGIDYQ